MKVLLSAWLLVLLPATAGGAALSHTTVPYFPSSTHSSGHGFVRLINHSVHAGDVSIRGTDDRGMAVGPVTMSLGPGQTVHLNSFDLERGNASKFISGGMGTGTGDWWLELSSGLNIEALAYMRSDDGFLTSMFESVPGIANRHRIAVFNPASNRHQVSRLRLVNPGAEAAEIGVEGTDDAGEVGSASISIPPATAISLTAAHLESGRPEGLPANVRIAGALGDGRGKWRLTVTADTPVVVMNLLESPTGHLTNLSAAPDLLWRGLTVAPRSRCPGHRYERNEYGTRYRSKEDEIIEDLGGAYSPYSGECLAAGQGRAIEHMVAINEAHHSGLCTADRETKREFAGDPLNLTFASTEVNTAKSNRDAFDWLPEQNRCWFARRVMDVKLKYRMTVDRDEAAALERVLAACAHTDLVATACAGQT